MDAFTFTWIANVEKSQRHPNHLFTSATLRFQRDGDALSLIQSGINMSGKHESSTLTLHPDGQEHPVSPQAPGVVVITKFLTPRLLETRGLKDGVELGYGTYEVSSDGARLTAKVRGIDAAATPFEQVIVFDRQESDAKVGDDHRTS
jgi:hypothetical protein